MNTWEVQFVYLDDTEPEAFYYKVDANTKEEAIALTRNIFMPIEILNVRRAERLWICKYVEADDDETIIKVENGELPDYPKHEFRVWATDKNEAIEKFLKWAGTRWYPISLLSLKETDIKFEEVE